MQAHEKTKKTKCLLKDKEGSTGVIFALLATPLMALTGMAVEYGRVMNSRESMQQSLDAAVLAGRNAPSDKQISIAQSYFKANLKKVIANAKAEFRINGDGDLEGTSVAYVETPIAGLAGHSALKVEAFALARPDRDEETDAPAASGVIPCIHVMDQSGSKTFWLDSNSSLDAGNCQVRVRSNHASAMYEVSSSKVKFNKILVKGGASINSGYGTDKLYITSGDHKVTEQAAVVGNPYDSAVSAVSRMISAGSCTTANNNKTWTGTVNPGTFCGVTEFKNATLNAGVYIIRTSTGKTGKDGALKLSGSINGSAGVTFYFADNKSVFSSYNLDENSVLKAPTSGVTRGLLFMENSNRGSNYSLTIASCKKQSWTGMVYLPSVNLTFDSLSEWPTFNVAVAANQFKAKSLSSMTLQPYSWTPYGYSQPIMLDGEKQISRREGWLLE